MRIGIIGAGVGGLTAAYDLVKAGHSVTIFEREAKPGGLASGFKIDRWEWSVEKFYHHWFWTDKPIKNLIAELGLSENLLFTSPKTVVYHAGDFYPLDSVSAVLSFPGFSLVDKLRFGAVTAYLKYFSGWKNLERFTAVEWIKRYYGKNLYSIFFEPLLIGKFNDQYKDVNMAWMWARFKARSAKLGTYRGGFQAFLDDFTDILQALKVELLFNTTVANFNPIENDRLSLQTSTGEFYEFDQVLTTLPPKLLTKMVSNLPGEYTNTINRLKGTGAIVIVFSLKHSLSGQGYYWYNLPKSAGFPFLALVEHTNFLHPKFFNGEHIIYCGDYLDSSHPYFSLSDRELSEIYSSAFSRINQKFSKDWINDFWLFKTPFAQPVPGIDHSENILDIETPVPGLFLASMSQIYPWDRGTNYAVSFAHKAVKTMLSKKNRA